jgi:predicted secreted protein with PEFG-CTERM motif
MDYKAYALMAILLASVASVALVGAAYAQSTLTVQTDKDNYTTGDDITISGKLTATTINQPLLIQVLDPQGNRDRIDQVTAAADGSYTYKFRAGGLMNTNGEYTVKVSYKTTEEETTFQFTATGGTGPEWKTFNIKVGDKTYPVQYKITGGTVQNMVPEETTATLTVTISSTADGNLQIRLPRNVIESRAGADGRSGADADFAVFADEENVEPEESEPATVDQRTLSIDFAQGTESIEIVGSWAIPEFGAIAAIILAVAIVGIIVATATYSKKFNFAPRL